MGRFFYQVIVACLIPFWGWGQLHLDGSTQEVYPAEFQLKKPPKYEEHNPCEVIFINMTNIPVQLSWLKPSGNFEKLFYLAEKDTLKFPFKTNHHIVVSYLGYQAVSVFIPGFDKNICKIHDKQFKKAKKIPLRKFKFKSDELKQEKYKFKPKTPAYKKGTGSTIYVDQFHANPNLKSELFSLQKALKNDGYNIQPFLNDFSEQSLKDVHYLILPQPLTPTVNGWKIDSTEAYTQKEYEALFQWIENGGKLIVLSDYTAMGSRLKTLNNWLNINYYNGIIQEKGMPVPTEYTLAEKSLVERFYVNGRTNLEAIESIYSFGGAAFETKDEHKLLNLTESQNAELVTFSVSNTDVINANGMTQAAFFKKGEGQVVLISNLNMFQSWIHKETGNKIGMNNPLAYQNAQFFLNIIHALQGFVSFE